MTKEQDMILAREVDLERNDFFVRHRAADFLALIQERTPNGEWISVKYHPNGDWSVGHAPITAEVERAAVVDWLNHRLENCDSGDLADAIERGDHHHDRNG